MGKRSLSPVELQLVLTHYLGQLCLHRSPMAGWQNYRAKGEWKDQHSIWHLHIFPYFSDTGQPHLPHSPGSTSASRVLSKHEDTAENKLRPNKSGQLQYTDAQLEEFMSNRQWHSRHPLIMKAWMSCLSKTLWMRFVCSIRRVSEININIGHHSAKLHKPKPLHSGAISLTLLQNQGHSC